MRFNAQAKARAHLADALPDVKVAVRASAKRPDVFVLVRREGGARQDKYRDRAGIGIECWAPTEAEAYDLADKASRAMLTMEYENGVAAVEEEAFYSDPDPADGSPRWYGSYTLTTYEIKE